MHITVKPETLLFPVGIISVRKWLTISLVVEFNPRVSTAKNAFAESGEFAVTEKIQLAPFFMTYEKKVSSEFLQSNLFSISLPTDCHVIQYHGITI